MNLEVRTLGVQEIGMDEKCLGKRVLRATDHANESQNTAARGGKQTRIAIVSPVVGSEF